jgi:hypothetical protein
VRFRAKCYTSIVEQTQRLGSAKDIREKPMSYVNDNLMPNERVLFSARVHPAIFLPAVIVFVLTIAVGIFAFNLQVELGSIAG